MGSLPYRARSTISTSRHRLSFDSGLVSMMRTVSPVFAVFSSSCAFTRFVRVTILPYTGCGTRRSRATTTVFCILSLTTRPTRDLRAARSVVVSVLVVSAIAYRSPAPPAASRSRSRSTVFIRATSLRMERSRSGSSSVSVAARKRRRKRSSSSPAMRVRTSASVNSRISSARTGVRLLARDELGLDTDLRRGEPHRLLGGLARHALELEHHAARLHHRHPPFGRALALSHSRLGRLLRDRLVR